MLASTATIIIMCVIVLMGTCMKLLFWIDDNYGLRYGHAATIIGLWVFFIVVFYIKGAYR